MAGLGIGLTAQPSTYPGVTATKVAQMMGQDSAVMRQANTDGMKAANRRGLANSSIAIGASQDAMIRAATPIASQDAGIDAQEKATIINAAAQAGDSYNQALAQTLSNDKIPVDARSAVQSSIAGTRQSIEDLMQRVYGMNLNIGSNA